MPSVAPPRSDAFVGRVHELTTLRRGLESAFAGRGRLFLLVGEAGIGKTRLADEISEQAERSGARVLWGRCWESGGAPPFWPWNQLIRSYGSERAKAPVLELTPSRGSQAAAAAAEQPDPEQARFQLFDETARFLRAAASDQPLVMILDDLHAADVGSLLLLRFLARELRTAPWLLIGTYRDVEASQQPEIGRLLSEIAREGQRLSLVGLSRGETIDYISASTEQPPTAPAIEAVYQITEGNPFFLAEVVRLLTRFDGDPAAGAVRQMIPDEVRAAIRQRLAGLSDRIKRLLAIAAVIGREFDATVLEPAAAGEFERDELLRLLDEARQANAITAVPGVLRRYSFAHLLVRDTLFDDLSIAERALLHRRIAESIEHLSTATPAAHLAEIAHHYAQAATTGCIDQAVDYAQRAGEQALKLLAYEEAAGNFQRALDCLELRRMNPHPDDALRRCQLLMLLGDAQWGTSDLATLRITFQNAAKIAETLAEPERGLWLARAALGLGGRQQRAHVELDETVVQLLERAQAALDPSDSVLRARVLARLAYALYAAPGSVVRRRELCQEAVRMARRLGDAATLRWVLNDWRWALWGPDNLEDRLRIADELVVLAQQYGDREMVLTEHAWRLVDFLELGDLAAVRAELRIYVELAQELRLPWYHWYVARFRALLATMEGQFAEAERLAEAGLSTAQRVQHQDAFLIYATQMMTLRVEQGRLDELEGGLQGLVAKYPAVPVWRYLLAFLHSAQGRQPQSRSELNRIAARDFADVPDDYLRLANLTYLAEVVLFLDDDRRAQQLYDLLQPYAERCVVIGYGIAFLGPVSRYLGMLAITLKRWEVAKAHLDSALEFCERIGAQPLIARTHVAIAELLLRHPGGREVDRRRAIERLSAAGRIAAELGMSGLTARIDALAEAASGKHAATTDASPALYRFRRDGEYWDISFGNGRPFRLKNLRGLAYLAYLLQNPRQEFHATQLVALFDGADESGGNLDATRRRVAELQEELANARSMHDFGRADALQTEMDQIVERLLASPVATASDKTAERARVSVTKRISIALQRLAVHDAALAHHLEANVKTGNYCSYSPDPTRPVAWEL